MKPTALLLLVAGWCLGARGEPAPSQEQADLQAAGLVEAATLSQVQAGGDARQAMERLDQLFADLEAKYPHSAAVRDAHGDYLWSAERKQEAFTQWQEAEKLDGNNADICLHLGSCWLENGDTQRATGYFERAAALAPRDALLHFHLGNDLYLFRHQLATPREPETAVVDRALGELRTAAELEPLNAEYARGYADTFYSIPVAKWPDALKAWQHFYEISEDKNLASINLARVSLQMKDRAAARMYLDQVTRPDFQGLKRKLMAQAEGRYGD